MLIKYKKATSPRDKVAFISPPLRPTLYTMPSPLNANTLNLQRFLRLCQSLLRCFAEPIYGLYIILLYTRTVVVAKT